MLTTVLILLAFLLTLIELIRSEGKSLLVWAVMFIIIAFGREALLVLVR